MLPSGLPNRVLVSGARYGKLPSPLQQKIGYAFGRDLLGDPVDPIQFPWAQLNNEQVTLSFEPATAEDEQALLALLPEGEITDVSQLPSSIPGYLIRVIPQLKVNGETVKTGSPIRLGEELELVTLVERANGGLTTRSYQVIAGSYLSLNVIAGSVSPQKLQDLQARLAETKSTLETQDPGLIQSLSREALLGDLFYSGTLGYYAQYLALSHITGFHQGARHYLAAGIGSVGYEPTVQYLFGLPRAIEPGGVS